MFGFHQTHYQTFGRASEQPVNHIADGVTDDLVAADDLFSMPVAGTLAFDTGLGRIVATESDPDITRRQQEQIQTMLATARGLRRVTHPAVVPYVLVADEPRQGVRTAR